MQITNDDNSALKPEDSWNAIYTTVDRTRSSMYLAGTASILLLWCVLMSLGYLSQYAIATLAPGVAESVPWFPAPMWGVLVIVGMICSSVIGHRAGKKNALGEAANSAGIRVFLYWLSVAAAAFLIPAIAGMWTSGQDGQSIARVTVGIVSLGYILFGIMHRPAIAAVGVGIAGAFYIPGYVAGEAAPFLSAIAMLLVVGLGAIWIRRSGIS